jgi:uncharacterized protein (DUF4213/DUF364 family)
MRQPSTFEQTASGFRAIVKSEGLLESNVEVLARPLTPEEAIGTPGRRDYPIITGKERMLEATFHEARGHAFTDSAREFTGPLREVCDLELSSNQNRAIYLATVNAVLRHLGKVAGTVHCKDDEPEQCGAEIARMVLAKHGPVDVGLIGLNPAIAEHLVMAFGADRVHITDMYSENIGHMRFGVEVWDAATSTTRLIRNSDVVLLTGTTLQNGTFNDIWKEVTVQGKHGIIFGVTGAAVCALTGIERMCPCGH